MPNPLKGEVELKAGEKSYILRFSIDAICTLEASVGKGFPVIAAELSKPDTVSITMLRHLLHAALSEHHPEITVKDAGELIKDAGGMPAVMAKVNDALSYAFPTKEASGTRRPPKRPRGRTG